MAMKFLTSINLSQNELQNAVIQNLGTAPLTPSEGQIFYNTGTHVPQYYNATQWVDMITDLSNTVPIALGSSALAGSGTTASRYDHQHPYTGLALLGAGNTFTTGTQTVQGALVVSGGAFTVDAQGRIGVVNAGVSTPRGVNVFSGALHPGSATSLYGVFNQPQYPSSTTTAAYTYFGQTQTQAASFTLIQAADYYAESPTIGSGSAITTKYGYWATNQGISGVTNAYGMFVAAQSNAATLNVSARFDTGTTAALWLGGDTTSTTVAGGIAFGSGRDVTLYRSTATTLTTDNTFQVGKVGSAGRIDVYASSASGSGAYGSIYMDGTNLGRMVLIAGQGSVAGENRLQIFSNTIPGIDVNYDLGHPAFRWSTIYASNATLTGNLIVSGGNFQVDSSGRLGFGGAPATDRWMSFGTHPGSATTLYGVLNQTAFPSTTTVAAHTFYAASKTAAASFTLSTAHAFHADTPSIGAASAITDAVGFAAINIGVSGVTNAYGIKVSAQSGASGVNIGARVDTATTAALWLGGDTTATDVTGGIAFGSGRDVTLYRSAAGTLNVGGSFTVNGSGVASIETVSNPVALGTASHGAGTTASAYDHVHPTTGVALLGSANTFTVGTQTFQGTVSITSGGLQVSAGNFQVDSSGRIGLNSSVNADRMIALGTGNPHPGNATTLYGMYSNTAFPSTTTVSGYANRTTVRLAAASFTMTAGYGYYADGPVLGASSALTTAEGFHSENQGGSGITNAYGLRIDAQSGAATLNVGARIDTATTAALWLGGDTTSTTVSGGIAFGSGRDVTLYRSASSQLTVHAGLVVDVGSHLVDSSGRMGVGGATINADALMNVGGATAHSSSATSLYGIILNPNMPSSATNQYLGYYSQVRTAAGSFTLANGASFYAEAPQVGASSAITTVRGFYASNQGISGVTNAYGLNLAAQSGAATLNVGARIDTATTAALWLGGDTTATDVTGGIAFGSGRDVSIYRSGSNALTLSASSGVTLSSHISINSSSVISDTDMTIQPSAGSGTVIIQSAGSTRLTVGNGILTLADGVNFVVGSSTGTKIGTAASQKLGFFNAAPIIQPAATTDIYTALQNLGLHGGGTSSFNIGTGALTAGATSLGGALNMNTHLINNVTDPASAQDAATKNYVDNTAQGLSPKGSCFCATTAALPTNDYANGTNGVGATLTGHVNGALGTIDGQSPWTAISQSVSACTNVTTTVTATVTSNTGMAVGMPIDIVGITGFTTNNPNGTFAVASLVGSTQFTYVVGNAPTGSYSSGGTVTANAARVLVKNEATAANNGTFTTTNLGSGSTKWILTRSLDMDDEYEVVGAFVYVEAGTALNGSLWVVTAPTGPITIGTTSITFTKMGGPSGYSAGKYTATGPGSPGSSWTVTHNLNTSDIVVSVRDHTSHAEEICDVTHTDANTVTLAFATSQSANTLDLVVIG